MLPLFIWLNFLKETVPAILVVYFKNLNPISNFLFHSIPFSVFTVVLGFPGCLFLIIQHFASLVLWFLVFQFQSPPLCFSIPSLTTKCFCGLMEYWIPSWKPCFYSDHFKSFFISLLSFSATFWYLGRTSEQFSLNLQSVHSVLIALPT